MIKHHRYIYFILAMLLVWVGEVGIEARTIQRFYNLTAEEVKVDSVLPSFAFAMPLSEGYGDSVYTVSLKYPEFIEMSQQEIGAYRKAIRNGVYADVDRSLQGMPLIRQDISLDRGSAELTASFCPIVRRGGRLQLLVSFMLEVTATPRTNISAAKAAAPLRSPMAEPAKDRYKAHSVLASGRWVKIRVPESGFYELSPSLLRKAGFSNASRVRLYGYGGALQSETLSAADLMAHDDLNEVKTFSVNGHRVFYAEGPVQFSKGPTRTRNPYSDYGYYFLTESDSTMAQMDSTEFNTLWQERYNNQYCLHEVDNYAWYHGGRNLYENTPISQGKSHTYVMKPNFSGVGGQLRVVVSAGVNSTVSVSLNGQELGQLYVYIGSSEYDKGASDYDIFDIDSVSATDSITLTTISGGPVRLDYLLLSTDKELEKPDWHTATFAEPEYVYAITNQDHHADAQADMVIIIPTSQKLRTQAERLKAFHEKRDSLRINIVPADELYNEFSSGTPDAGAYRRYLKMLYDRAETAADRPRYLLLFGTSLWDNRLLTSSAKTYSADDLLLCYESENSFSEVNCYVDDGFFAFLDDGESVSTYSSAKMDVAVGRFPVMTAEEAKVMVDKTIGYAENKNGGAWQNRLVFMGDDGNQNVHMRDVNSVADEVISNHPGMVVSKVMWDAYTRQSSATGYGYPEATNLIKSYQQQGALIMDYAGHGSEYEISHEGVLWLTDFKSFSNSNLPLWVTASCDIMPFDAGSECIGVQAVLNPVGGAVAFFGTTRTVYTNYNKLINAAFIRRVLTFDGTQPITIGEAARQAKNSMFTGSAMQKTNTLQYSLLGDPALRLNLPSLKIVVDSINGQSASSSKLTLEAGSVVRVKAHVEGAAAFNGVATAVVRDSKETITCKLNDTSDSGADRAFVYTDRTKTLFQGSDSVRAGQIDFSFVVPRDINYTTERALMNIFAISTDRTMLANGYADNFCFNGTDVEATDSIGPDVYCYLNTPDFVDGGTVNSTPFFVAQIADDDGINVTGNGIGHNLELVVDGDMNKTYDLNDNFAYDFGSYTTGTTFYSIPALSPGRHQLEFRAWDMQNNCTTRRLRFNVVEGLTPSIFSVGVTNNPARTNTTFIISHNRAGSNVDVRIEVFDMSGRLLWRHDESGVSTGSAYTVDWDLSVDDGHQLQTGVYIYRVSMSSDGSREVSKAKKLIVINNN